MVGVRSHPAPIVGWYRTQVGGSEAQEAQNVIYCDVSLLAGDDSDRRRAGEAVSLNVPAHRLEHTMAGSGERSEVRHLAAGHEPKVGILGQPEQLEEPCSARLLDPRGCWGGNVKPVKPNPNVPRLKKALSRRSKGRSAAYLSRVSSLLASRR